MAGSQPTSVLRFQSPEIYLLALAFVLNCLRASAALIGLETPPISRQDPEGHCMKRLIVITCAFLVFLTGVASVWAACQQIFSAPDKFHNSAAPAHAHHHHSDADQNHSHGASIHCPTLDEFLPVASFSISNDSRVERLLDGCTALVANRTSRNEYGSTHGPPGFASLRFTPTYLLLSVLRI